MTYERMESVALAVATEHGLTSVTRDSVAKAYGCAPALVSHYFGTVDAMKRAVALRAAAENNGRVVAEASLLGFLPGATGPEAGGAAVEYLERKLRGF